MTERLQQDPELAAAYRRAHESYLAERDAIEPLVLARPLRPVLGLQVRREHALLRLAERTLGELVFDQVTAASDGRRAAASACATLMPGRSRATP